MNRALLTASSYVLLVLTARAPADVVILDNRTSQPLTVQWQAAGQLPKPLRLPAGTCVPMFVDAAPSIGITRGGRVIEYQLRLQSAYFIAEQADGSPDLVQIGIGDESGPPPQRELPGDALAPVAMIPVKVLVDEEERSRRSLWERRLRDRVAAASKIMQAHAGVGFTVIAADEWRTDDAVNDFNQTLRTFEQVSPQPAQLAIGFTSQYELVKGRVHLGGTRGPLAAHVLMREWSQHVSENERMELLVHELGHYLGAAHSPEAESVMRPVLGDRRARRREFVIRFDPVNTLAIAMVGEEIRRRRISNFAALTLPTRQRLADVYQALAPAQPDDKTARMLTARLRLPRSPKRPGATDRPAPTPPPDAEAVAVRSIISSIVTAARENKQSETPVVGDELFDSYVRAAASAARRQPEDVRVERMLAALCLSLDAQAGRKLVSELVELSDRSETDGSRAVRTALIGRPTLAGRADTLKHFLLSAYLAHKRSPAAAEALGIAKELADAAPGGSGLSVADLTADLAGIRFAQWLSDDPDAVAALADSHRASQFVPSLDGLPAPMSLAEVAANYGDPSGEKFKAELARIRNRVESLPVYRQQPSTPSQ